MMTEISEVKIPDRMFFKIGDVSRLTGLEPYVLRYWESEFDIIKPSKSNKNQRVYRQEDVKKILLIKHLLYSERYSIEGAKRRLVELREQKREVRRNSIVDDKELKILRMKAAQLVAFVEKFPF